MAFGTDANKKPSEIDPKDYIPRVPEALRQKFSKDPQNISSQSKNSVIDSPVKGTNQVATGRSKKVKGIIRDLRKRRIRIS
jgi:hypothetical protein